jgi:hypothetical protein
MESQPGSSFVQEKLSENREEEEVEDNQRERIVDKYKSRSTSLSTSRLEAELPDPDDYL